MTSPEKGHPDRRDFIRISAGCGAHLFLLSAFAPARAARVFEASAGEIRAQEPWGRIEEVADGVWALISTPLQDRTTLCNGGIIRGQSGVLVVESFARPEGASWLAGRARALTGRWPDHVILTHYHGDHTGGVAGFAREEGAPPAIHATMVTRDLVRRQDAQRNEDPASTRSTMLAGATEIEASTESTLDLGGRNVRIIPRQGHTQSDVTIEMDDPAVVFCGDLVWNRMFPNYVDATPSHLSRDVRALIRESDAAYVPGHGPRADRADMDRYVTLLDSVEAAARSAKARGMSAADAAVEYRVPDSLGEWTLFNPRYYETAIGAWLNELG
jgi:glyoxylase-like metal-dependent hydrolase (beta-lactamase superfamily II)